MAPKASITSSRSAAAATPSVFGGDVIHALGAIDAPLLLLHGERDGVCPPSHSRVVFHALHSRGVPTELVLYPEEGHTVELPRHRRDAARRVCAWLLEHVPVADPTSK